MSKHVGVEKYRELDAQVQLTEHASSYMACFFYILSLPSLGVIFNITGEEVCERSNLVAALD